MENYNISNLDNDTEILKAIIDILLNLYPIVDDRMDILFPPFGKKIPELNINFCFHEIDNQNVTMVSFLAGNRDYKCATPNDLQINGLISKKVVCDFISYLLSDHDVFKDIHKWFNRIELPMTINLCDENMHGISCGDITLSFDFSRHPNCENLLNDYLKVIVTTFCDKLQTTATFKREFSKYCGFVKNEFIDSLSEEQLKVFVSLLNMEDLCKVLYSLPDDRFIELYEEYNNQDKTKQLTKNFKNQ